MLLAVMPQVSSVALSDGSALPTPATSNTSLHLKNLAATQRMLLAVMPQMSSVVLCDGSTLPTLGI
jgi:hypothetical protein